MTSPEKQVLKTKICCSCKEEKRPKDFYVNNHNKDGLSYRCKECFQSGKICVRNATPRVKYNRKGRPTTDFPQLYNVKEQDWIETYKFLEKIGYDLTKNSHLQFCEKHNLKPRKRLKEKSIIYSPEDLGLI